jgi:hypothetical protein
LPSRSVVTPAGRPASRTPTIAEIAAAPTGTQFHEATFTDSGPLARITGGALQPDTDTNPATVHPNTAAGPATPPPTFR